MSLLMSSSASTQASRFGFGGWSFVGVVFQPAFIFPFWIIHTCLGFGVGSLSDDGHVSVSKLGTFVPAAVPRTGLLSHDSRSSRLQRPQP